MPVAKVRFREWREVCRRVETKHEKKKEDKDRVFRLRDVLFWEKPRVRGALSPMVLCEVIKLEASAPSSVAEVRPQ